MPNWCYNSITIKGDDSRINALVNRLSEPRPVDKQGSLREGPLSFWNIFAPTDLDAYFDVVGSDGRSSSDSLGWYGWNLSHWGCKWDASDVIIDFDSGEVTYHFSTPWGPPEPIFNWLISYCGDHDLDISIGWEEEGGEGAEWQGAEWGPLVRATSHAEFEQRGEECFCLDYDDDEDRPFDDCPPPIDVIEAAVQYLLWKNEEKLPE